MAQERHDSESARVVAVQSLKNELELAVRLLRGVKEARETMAMEIAMPSIRRAAHFAMR